MVSYDIYPNNDIQQDIDWLTEWIDYFHDLDNAYWYVGGKESGAAASYMTDIQPGADYMYEAYNATCEEMSAAASYLEQARMVLEHFRDGRADRYSGTRYDDQYTFNENVGIQEA